ncbi:MAG: acyl-CoA thioester hydrolase [Rhodobacteraceae bacterium HLUCCA08]|nr:MAG: acyl-CoA thioester hydrolase [Rhodobacteraceae bacterium HLUCCA08]
MDIPYLTPLPVDMLRRLGIPSDWNFGLADRVRFSELDALGHVNNAAYLSWFENVRLPYLAQARVTDYGPSAPRLVIAELGVRYLKEMLRGEVYVLTARTASYRNSSFQTDYAVFRITDSTAELTCSSRAAIVLRSRDGTGKLPIPDAAIAHFTRVDGATKET